MSFFISQFTPLPIAKTDLTDRTVIVTGSNVGLGLEAARHLARMNPKKLILACRNTDKGNTAVRSINETTGVAKGVVECWELDLSSFENVKAFAKRVEKDLGRLDILIENAGVATRQYRSTVDGWEETLEVNALSTFLLAFLLLPLLRKTTSLSSVHPRLVILSSGVHAWTKLEEYRDADNIFQAMSDKEQFKGAGRYPLSKLLDTLLTCELGERLKSSKHPEDQKISLSGVNPGLCKTELSRESDSWAFKTMILLLARTAEQGSRTLTHAAVGTDGEDFKGEYLSDCGVDKYSPGWIVDTNGRVSPFVVSEEGKKTQLKLWNEMMEILGKVAPEIEKLF